MVVSRAPSGNVDASPAAADQKVNEGTVDVTVEAVNISPVIHSPAQQPDRSMEIRASGVPDRPYLIQARENLGDSWATIGTNSADANGIIVFLDRNATNYTSRFYRLATP